MQNSPVLLLTGMWTALLCQQQLQHDRIYRLIMKMGPCICILIFPEGRCIMLRIRLLRWRKIRRLIVRIISDWRGTLNFRFCRNWNFWPSIRINAGKEKRVLMLPVIPKRVVVIGEIRKVSDAGHILPGKPWSSKAGWLTTRLLMRNTAWTL